MFTSARDLKLAGGTLLLHTTPTGPRGGLSLIFVARKNFSTSETLRHILPAMYFNPLIHNKLNDKDFGSYLAGLWEADGHASSSQQIIITFCSQDETFALYLSTFF